jgi:hypothetical protein
MGTLFVLIGGLIGAGSSYQKSFAACWIVLVNFAFSLYISIFLAPLAVPLMEVVPGLETGYKNAVTIGIIFIVFYYLLQFITSQIIPNPEKGISLPPAAQIGSAAAGFLSGIIIAGILLYCFMQTPFVSGFSQRKELRATARNTLMGVVHTLNIFSFQSLTPEAKKDLQSIRLIPKKKTVPPAKAGQKNQSRPAENKPAEESVKKDSAAVPGNQPEKPAENRKTD